MKNLAQRTGMNVFPLRDDKKQTGQPEHSIHSDKQQSKRLNCSHNIAPCYGAADDQEKVKEGKADGQGKGIISKQEELP